MKKRKRRGKLMWACMGWDDGYYINKVRCKGEDISHDRHTSIPLEACSGLRLKPGEGPVRVRVTIERERSQR